jgi:hypothetical protein
MPSAQPLWMLCLQGVLLLATADVRLNVPQVPLHGLQGWMHGPKILIFMDAWMGVIVQLLWEGFGIVWILMGKIEKSLSLFLAESTEDHPMIA